MRTGYGKNQQQKRTANKATDDDTNGFSLALSVSWPHLHRDHARRTHTAAHSATNAAGSIDHGITAAPNANRPARAGIHAAATSRAVITIWYGDSLSTHISITPSLAISLAISPRMLIDTLSMNLLYCLLCQKSHPKMEEERHSLTLFQKLYRNGAIDETKNRPQDVDDAADDQRCPAGTPGKHGI